MEFKPIAPEQMTNESMLDQWKRQFKQDLKKYDKARKSGKAIEVNINSQKDLDKFEKTLAVYLKQFTDEYRDQLEDRIIDDIEEAHNKEYKITKIKDKKKTEFVTDNYKKHIEKEYGENIPGVRRLM